MELYNQLLKEFHCANLPHDAIPQYKSLADELASLRKKKKMHYLIKRNELKNLRSVGRESAGMSRVATEEGNVSSLSIVHNEDVSNAKLDLKKEIEEIEFEISVLREKSQEINVQLQLYSQKSEELKVINKRSELDVFNAVQQLYIEAGRVNGQEVREQQMLAQLRRRRGAITEEIEEMVKRKKESDQIVKKWNRSKKVRMKSAQVFGVSVCELKQIIKTMFQMKEIKQFSVGGNGYYKNKEQKQNDMLKETKTKIEIIAILSKNNIKFNDKFADEIISFYKELEMQLDRSQRANKQINNHLKNLHQNDQKLTNMLQKAINKKDKQTQKTLKQVEECVKETEYNFGVNCKLITHFSIIFFMLVRRLHSFRKSIHNILIEAKSDLSSKMVGLETVQKTLQRYEQYLYRNLEELQMKWGQADSPTMQFYKTYIQTNDLIRLFANPEGFNKDNDDLNNYEAFIISSFRNMSEFLKKMCEQLKLYFRQTKFNKLMPKYRQSLQLKDKFCVQSKQYYRQDNYKLLQKMANIQLKKKGLLFQIPFNLKVQNQLNVTDEDHDRRQFSSIFTSRRPTTHRETLKYTSLATKREESSHKSSILRKMLGRINCLSSRSSSRILKCRASLNSSKLTMNQTLTSFAPLRSDESSILRLPRNTVGATQRLNNILNVGNIGR